MFFFVCFFVANVIFVPNLKSNPGPGVSSVFQNFQLFLLLIANSGNYLHLSIVVHYVTVCNNNVLSVNYNFKSPLKCLETRTVILCVDVSLTETGRQGRTYQAAPPPFQIANRVRLYHSLG